MNSSPRLNEARRRHAFTYAQISERWETSDQAEGQSLAQQLASFESESTNINLGLAWAREYGAMNHSKPKKFAQALLVMVAVGSPQTAMVQELLTEPRESKSH
jgi:hypothetical protein